MISNEDNPKLDSHDTSQNSASDTSSKSGTKWVRFEDAGTPIDHPQPPNEPNVMIKPSPKQPLANVPYRQNAPADMSAPAADVAQIDVSMDEAAGPGTMSPPVPAGPAGPTGYQVLWENAKNICTILPDNQICPWILPAHFDAYKMPKSLVSDQLTMPVEEYVTAMELLSNDYRFRLYTICYRRLIAIWLVMSFFILLIILFSGPKRLLLFLLILFWLFLLAFGIIGCLVLKKRINVGLHHLMVSVNNLLLKYNLIIGVEDRGKLSCHKIAIHFLYFKWEECLPRIEQQIVQHDQNNGSAGVPSVSVTIDGRAMTVRERARGLILKHSQSYVKAVLRRTIKFPTRPSEGVADFAPLHCSKVYCLCQYIQKYHFERKAKKWYERFF